MIRKLSGAGASTKSLERLYLLESEARGKLDLSNLSLWYGICDM